MNLQRDRILACACELFVQGGLEGLSMRKLARSLGVTAPALYRHYESKEKVLYDVVGEAYRTFAQYLYGALEGQDAEERFYLTGRAYMTFALKHPQYYEVLHISPALMGLEELPEEVSAQACASGQFLVDRVREAIDTRILKQGDAEAVARTIWAHSHGMVSIYHRGHLRMSEGEFRRFFLESSWMLMAGIGDEEFVKAHALEAREAALREEGLEVAATGD
jgi:AcrR family transcriptional regulator